VHADRERAALGFVARVELAEERGVEAAVLLPHPIEHALALEARAPGRATMRERAKSRDDAGTRRVARR
jgi:hypothetical protein